MANYLLSSAIARLALFAAVLPALWAACVETKPGVTGTQSLRITMESPSDLGSPTTRLPVGAQPSKVRIKIEALNEDNVVDASFSRSVAVYSQFLATLSPALGSTPLAQVPLVNGVSASTEITLPRAFGATTLWIEDSLGEGATFATGTTPPIWFRDPFVVDIQRPTDENSSTAFYQSPLEDKQMRVSASRHGANGRLVVTSVFAQGYTVSDVTCTSDAGPCTADDYDHTLIFSFSRPRDTNGRSVQPGQFIEGFTGGVVEFNGLTELSFPQTLQENEPTVNVARIPAPKVVDETWLAANKINFERNEAAPVQVNGAKLCPLDADFDRFKQWKLSLNGNCGNRNSIINVVSTGFSFDPAANVNATMTKVVGIVKPVSGVSRTSGQPFNIFIIFPRDEADIVR